MKILILGANGYLGNALLHYFNTSNEVIAYDRIFTIDPVDNVKYIKGDYEVLNTYSAYVIECDIIINCIGLSGAVNSVRNTIKYNEINIDAHLQFINFLYNLNEEKKLIFISSRLVYGITGNKVIDEKTICNPIDFYGVQKKTIEDYLKVYSMLNPKVSVSIARLTNPYGYYIKPNNTPGYNFINSLIGKIKSEEEIIIYGDGNQKRDYIHIHDVVSAFETLIYKKETYNVYNVGYGDSLSICEAIDIISDCVGKRVNTKHIDWPALDLKIETGDCYISNKKLLNAGWKPKYDFRSGITNILEKL